MNRTRTTWAGVVLTIIGLAQPFIAFAMMPVELKSEGFQQLVHLTSMVFVGGGLLGVGLTLIMCIVVSRTQILEKPSEG